MVNMEDCVRSISVDGELDTTPQYSVSQVAKMLEISVHTLRYYDDLGLFPFLQRGTGSKRLFSDADIQWVKLIECLRNSGMSLAEVKHYVELCLEGDNTLTERLAIVQKQEYIMKQQMKELKERLRLLRFKKNYYQKRLETR